MLQQAMEVIPRRTNMMSPSMSWLRNSPRSSSLGLTRGALRNTLRRQGPLGDSRSLSALENLASASAASGSHGVAAAVASSVLSQTARGFLASYDQRLSQSFWSHQASPKQRLAPVASRAARRENFKKERYATAIDRIVDEVKEEVVPPPNHRLSVVSGKSGSPKRRKSRRATLESLEKAVKEGTNVSEVVGLIHTASQRHRDFNPNESLKRREQEAREAKEREEREQDEQDALSHHNLKSLAQLSNPRWRVEEKVKRERQLRKENGSSPPQCTQRLPMTLYAAHGEKGREEVSMVDIKAIQNKCRGLSSTCSAKSLLELQRLREQQAAEAEASKRDLESRLNANKSQLQALAAMDWEDRLEMAQQRKLENHVTTVFNKMSTMRGKYPKDIPDSLQNHLQAMKLGDYSWHEEC